MNEINTSKDVAIEDNLISILTTTYNRADYLPRLFRSLYNQKTDADFEWVIVSDGSDDSTDEVVGNFLRDRFQIRYYKQDHAGRHIALNNIFKLARGEAYILADDDDELMPGAIEWFSRMWNQYKEDGISGIGARCIDGDTGKLVGKPYPAKINTYSWKKRLRIASKSGEGRGIARTEYVRRFTFPSIESLDFIPEGYLWNRINSEYESYFFNEPVYVYWQRHGDSLMNRKRSKERYESDFVMYKFMLNDSYMTPSKITLLHLARIYKLRLAAVRTGKTGRELYKGLKKEDQILLFLTRMPCWLMRVMRKE